jgi:hypothetical protein
MYDNVRRCPNCHEDAPCGGALSKCLNCGGVYCGSCMGNGYGGSCPYCGGNESKSF